MATEPVCGPLNRLIDRAFVGHLRRERAAKRGHGWIRCSTNGHDPYATASNGHSDRRVGKRSRSQIELSELALDLTTATYTLTPEQQQLCAQIKWKSVPEIA